MQSYDFEVACKNAIINKVKIEYNEDLAIQELQLVWFSKSLFNYKCAVIDTRPENDRYYECTYNGNVKKLYIDIYEKKFNYSIDESELSTKVVNKQCSN